MEYGRQRLLNYSQIPPEQMRGTVLRMPNLKKYFMRIHEKGDMWGERSCETQNLEGFRFEGRMFTEYARRVLKGRKVGRVYFPAVFTGKVAKAIFSEGIEVLASDLNPRWVENARGLGMEAEQRSFEELPDGKFDAVVSFEPWPVSYNPIGYVGLLGIFSRHMPLILISKSHSEKFSGKNRNLAIPRGIRFSHRTFLDLETGKFVGTYPHVGEELERIGYDYGARWTCHEAYGPDLNAFKFIGMVPDLRTSVSSGIDSRLIGILGDWSKADISINEVARMIGTAPEIVAAGLSRIENVMQRFFQTMREVFRESGTKEILIRD